MNDDSILRARARACLETGTLPAERPDRSWGGPGSGAACVICGAPIAAEELELEIEFDGDGTPILRYHAHVRCHSAWDVERRAFARNGASRAPSDQQRTNAVERAARRSALPDPLEAGKMAADAGKGIHRRGTV